MPTREFSKLNKRLLKAPGLIIIAYFFIGIMISIFGPLEYQGYRELDVALYVGAVILFFYAGYSLGIRLRTPIKAIWRKDQNKTILSYIFRISLIFALLMMTYDLLFTWFSGGLHFSLVNSAASYISTYTGYERNSGSYSLRFLITSAGALPLFVAQVLGIFYFKSLSRTSRILVIYLFAAMIIVHTLGGGKQKQFGDILIYVFSVFLATQAGSGKLKLMTLMQVGGALLGGVYVLLTLLAFRYQAIGISLSDLNSNLHPLIQYRGEGWIESALGEALAFPIVMFSGYLGQGYYGLSLALEQPFTWTAFGGSSYSISVILNQFFGAKFWVAENYPYLVGYSTGWGQAKWHTAFAWLASDLTFTGVVLFMGLVGFMYGRAWREVILYQNPFSVLLFALLNIGLIYAPANNQLMHAPGGLLTTFGVVIFYILFHKNFNATPATLAQRRFRLKR